MRKSQDHGGTVEGFGTVRPVHRNSGKCLEQLADTFPLDRSLVTTPRTVRQTGHWARLVFIDKAITNPDGHCGDDCQRHALGHGGRGRGRSPPSWCRNSRPGHEAASLRPIAVGRTAGADACSATSRSAVNSEASLPTRCLVGDFMTRQSGAGLDVGQRHLRHTRRGGGTPVLRGAAARVEQSPAPSCP